MKKFFIKLVCLIGLSNWVIAQNAGYPDTSFNATGFVSTSVSATNEGAYAVDIQADGKIVTGGVANNGTDNVFALVRYNTNGSLDNSFGTGGIVTTDIGPGEDVMFAMVIQANGKIVAGGRTGNSSQEFALARYNTDGTLDLSFGNAGIVISSISPGADAINAILIQPDGKIVVGGSNSTACVLARYNTTGSLDNTFGNNGVVLITAANSLEISSILIQPDGKIVTGGMSDNGAWQFQVARYNSNGTVDNTFGTAGYTSLGMGFSASIYSIALQPDGKIVAAGYVQWPTGVMYDFAVARFNSNGTLDNTFGVNGYVTTSYGGSTASIAYSVLIQPDGKIVASGEADQVSDVYALARYLPDGTLDTSFGILGTGLVAIIGGSTIYASKLQTDGRIVVAGNNYNVSISNFSAGRFHSGLITGIADPGEYFNQITLTPNPANEIINVTLPKENHNQKIVKIFDIAGKEVYSASLTDEQGNVIKIPVSHLLPGFYHLILNAGESKLNGKFVIER